VFLSAAVMFSHPVYGSFPIFPSRFRFYRDYRNLPRNLPLLIESIKIFPEIFPSGSAPDTSAWRRVHASFRAMCAAGVDPTRYVMVGEEFSFVWVIFRYPCERGRFSSSPKRGMFWSGGGFSSKKGGFWPHLPLFQGEERGNSRIPCNKIV